MAYDALGNLCSQATTGSITNTSQTYTYAGPAGCTNHGSSGSADAVASITGTTSATYLYDADGNQTTRSSDNRTLTYNVLNQLVTATLGTNVTSFQYGPDGDRFVRNDNGTYTFYVGKVEIQTSNGVVLEQRRYLGVAIDMVVTNDTRFVFSDHLGSIDAIAHADGSRVEAGSFDAWGNRRNPDTWQNVAQTAPLSTTTHGFTGQEHVDEFGIIHMNGRIYDPQLGKMLQADPLTGPGSQGLNRYSYVANNPLTLTDPTGYSFWNSFFGSVVHVVIDAVLYASGNGEFAPWVDAVWAAAATNGNIGAAAAAFVASYVTYNYIPSGGGGWGNFVNNPSQFLIAAGARALETGILQGTLATLQGQSFGSAFRSAAISSFASSFGPSGTSPTTGVIRAMIGGTASAASGGKFANGAITALAQWAAESATEKYQDDLAKGKGSQSNNASPTGTYTKSLLYWTMDDAAQGALDASNYLSIAKNMEYGGLIYQDPVTGMYYFTGPVPGGQAGFSPKTAVDLNPNSGDIVGEYHDHADYSVDGGNGVAIRTSDSALDDFNSDNFSPKDISAANSIYAIDPTTGFKSYLGIPSGNYKVYNPATGVVSKFP